MLKKIDQFIAICVLLIVLSLTLTVILLDGVNANTSISIRAKSDSYIDSSNPASNFGESLFLYTHFYNESVAQASAGSSTQNKVGPIAETWIQFDLSAIPPDASISKAFLKMHTSMWGTRSNNKVGAFICEDTSWTESEISWNKAPKVNSTSLDICECADPDMDYEFNLSNVLEGKRSVSLVLQTTEFSKMPAVFNSKDLNPETGPTLIIDYSEPVDVRVIGVVILSVSCIAVLLTFLLRHKQE
jgi:hypothetical protein